MCSRVPRVGRHTWDFSHLSLISLSSLTFAFSFLSFIFHESLWPLWTHSTLVLIHCNLRRRIPVSHPRFPSFSPFGMLREVLALYPLTPSSISFVSHSHPQSSGVHTHLSADFLTTLTPSISQISQRDNRYTSFLHSHLSRPVPIHLSLGSLLSLLIPQGLSMLSPRSRGLRGVPAPAVILFSHSQVIISTSIFFFLFSFLPK